MATGTGSSLTGDPRALDRNSPMPLWAQLADELRRRLENAEPAQRFPTEVELADTYQVSRHTVREALRRLRAEGLVTSQRGRGSAVNPGRFEQRLGALYSLFRVIEDQGAEQRSTVRSLTTCTEPAVAARLNLPPDAELVYLQRLRLADGEPLALDTAWLPATLAAPLLHTDFSHTALYDELNARCGIRPDSGSEHISALLPTPDQRSALHLDATTAVFCIERLGRAGNQPVEWRSTLVRADRYALTVDWQPHAQLHLHGTLAS